jgi:subtilisin-like proprotein convertase family protein
VGPTELLAGRLLPAVTFVFAYEGQFGTGIGFEDAFLGQARRQALESSAAALGGIFSDTATITVAVKSVLDPSTSVLASAGGYFYPTLTPDFSHHIPATKILSGVDLNGMESDALLTVNWAWPWHLGDNPQPTEMDFKSTMMHELAHAIGFLSAIEGDGSSGLMAGTVVVSRESLAIAEGSSNTFTVRLSAQPATTVVVDVLRFEGDSDISVQSGALLTFSPGNWNVPQTVVVRAAEDADAETGAARLRVVRGDNRAEPLVTTVEADNEPADIVVSSPQLVVSEGRSGTITVRLAAPPTAERTVSIARGIGDTDLCIVSPATMTFTAANWNVPQTVTVAAKGDWDRENGWARFVITALGLRSAELAVTEQDTSLAWSEFDRFLSSRDGHSLIDSRSRVLEDSWAIHSVGGPKGNGLYFNGYNARKANGGSPVPIYSPDPWLSGSSGSNLDTTAPGFSTMLMAHAAKPGRGARSLSLIENGIFRDIGYELAGESNSAPVAFDDSGTEFSTNEDAALLLPDVLLNDIDPNRRDQDGLFVRSLTTTGTRGKVTLVGTGPPQTFTFPGPAGIPDTQQPSVFQIPVSGVAGRIRDMDLRLSIDHSFTADLDVYLISPSGTRIELFTDVGGNSANFLNTTISDEAFVSIEATGTRGPFTATLRPAGLLSSFDGEDANGIWKLEVTDDDRGVSGTLRSFSLIIRGQHVTYQPDGQFESLNDGQSATDLFSYTVEDSSGNTGTASASILVTGVTDQSLIVSSSSIRVAEGGSNSFTVKLATKPIGEVRVNVSRSGGDVDLSVSSGSTLTFTDANWSTPQVVTISAALDDDLFDGTAVFAVTAAGLPQVNVEAIEQDITSDIVLSSVSASGGTELTIRYEIRGRAVAPFEITFLRSDLDALYGDDVLLDTVSITAAADLVPGLHVKTLPTGGGVDAVALPGAGASGSSEEYSLLVVADGANVIPEADAAAVTEDNLVIFSGVYQGAGVVLVHTGPGNDTVVLAASGSSHSLQIGTQQALLSLPRSFPVFRSPA